MNMREQFGAEGQKKSLKICALAPAKVPHHSIDETGQWGNDVRGRKKILLSFFCGALAH